MLWSSSNDSETKYDGKLEKNVNDKDENLENRDKINDDEEDQD